MSGICPFFKKGNCKFGEACRLQHTVLCQETVKTEICTHHLSGTCKYLNTCKKVHLDLTEEEKSNLCPFFARGNCLHGVKCRKFHPTLEKEVEVVEVVEVVEDVEATEFPEDPEYTEYPYYADLDYPVDPYQEIDEENQDMLDGVFFHGTNPEYNEDIRLAALNAPKIQEDNHIVPDESLIDPEIQEDNIVPDESLINPEIQEEEEEDESEKYEDTITDHQQMSIINNNADLWIVGSMNCCGCNGYPLKDGPYNICPCINQQSIDTIVHICLGRAF